MFEVPTISDIHYSVEAPEGRDYTWGRLGHMAGWTRRILLPEEVWRLGGEGILLGMLGDREGVEREGEGLLPEEASS